jgi:probable H4MPT-linked C1 transfer pathway protein
MTTIGLDIGGANLKAAIPEGPARARPFPLWKRPNDLAKELASLVDDWPSASRFALTMTGELCDCYSDRREGVRHILQAVANVAGDRAISVWRTDGRFTSLSETLADPLPAASANWLALATFAGRFATRDSAILLDVGSTTTDIVPLLDGRPVPIGRSDFERLRSRELIYLGARRTPICALMQPGEGMAELFATTLDIGLVLGDIQEDECDLDTADGRPARRGYAHARLARMLGGDTDSISFADVCRFAEQIRDRQLQITLEALNAVAGRLTQPVSCGIVGGSGDWLAREVWTRFADSPPLALAARLGHDASTAACALAVAALLDELIVSCET